MGEEQSQSIYPLQLLCHSHKPNVWTGNTWWILHSIAWGRRPMEESPLALYLKNERAAGKEKVLKNNSASKSSGQRLSLSPPRTAPAVFTRQDDIAIHCLDLNYLLSSPGTALHSVGRCVPPRSPHRTEACRTGAVPLAGYP